MKVSENATIEEKNVIYHSPKRLFLLLERHIAARRTRDPSSGQRVEG